MPKISIILPAFNRADTITRALRSAQAQSFTDWELIAVDDGSTDNTAALVEGFDPRVKLIRQANAGMTAARNTAMAAASGEYFAFLDSDDEFLPHHLELCVAFLDSHPEAAFVSTELLEDFGHGRIVHHYRVETSDWYPRKAKVIGSDDMDLPAGETDDYLRVYDSREPIGEWGRKIVERAKPDREPFLYRGRIAEYMRYDYLIAITASVLRASLVKSLGPPEGRWGTGSDYHYLVRMCRQTQAHYISMPTFKKHEYAEDGKLPALGHIVTGHASLKFVREWQAAWDDLYWNGRTPDKSLRALRSLRQYWMAQMALNAGNRELALQNLKEARAGLPDYRDGTRLYWLTRCLPGTRLPSKAFHLLNRFLH